MKILGIAFILLFSSMSFSMENYKPVSLLTAIAVGGGGVLAGGSLINSGRLEFEEEFEKHIWDRELIKNKYIGKAAVGGAIQAASLLTAKLLANLAQGKSTTHNFQTYASSSALIAGVALIQVGMAQHTTEHRKRSSMQTYLHTLLLGSGLSFTGLLGLYFNK